MKGTAYRIPSVGRAGLLELNPYSPWVQHQMQQHRIRLCDALVRIYQHIMIRLMSLCALLRKSDWTGLARHVRMYYPPFHLVLTDHLHEQILLRSRPLGILCVFFFALFPVFIFILNCDSLSDVYAWITERT